MGRRYKSPTSNIKSNIFKLSIILYKLYITYDIFLCALQHFQKFIHGEVRDGDIFFSIKIFPRKHISSQPPPQPQPHPHLLWQISDMTEGGSCCHLVNVTYYYANYLTSLTHATEQSHLCELHAVKVTLNSLTNTPNQKQR